VNVFVNWPFQFPGILCSSVVLLEMDMAHVQRVNMYGSDVQSYKINAVS